MSLDPSVMAALREIDAYPEDPSASRGVEHTQTHISHVFLTAERVYKFRRAVALVLGPAQAAENPLAHVARQVEQQIADRVLVLVRALPRLLRANVAQRFFDLVQTEPKLVAGCARELGRQLFGRRHDAEFSNTVRARPAGRPAAIRGR